VNRAMRPKTPSKGIKSLRKRRRLLPAIRSQGLKAGELRGREEGGLEAGKKPKGD